MCVLPVQSGDVGQKPLLSSSDTFTRRQGPPHVLVCFSEAHLCHRSPSARPRPAHPAPVAIMISPLTSPHLNPFLAQWGSLEIPNTSSVPFYVHSENHHSTTLIRSNQNHWVHVPTDTTIKGLQPKTNWYKGEFQL